MRQAPEQPGSGRGNGCASASPFGERAAMAVLPGPGKLSIEELSAVLLAAEWTLAGSWAELTSAAEEARLQSGIAKLQARVERLKARHRKRR